jgi:hypothetical protein
MTDSNRSKTQQKLSLSTLELHELDEACHPIYAGFGTPPYLVGSAGERPDFRDVDVRLILGDKEYDALFEKRPNLWALLSRVIATYLRTRTSLPIDFQIQRQTDANARHKKPRNALGLRDLKDYAGGGDGTKGMANVRKRRTTHKGNKT